jgi:hypothetical protein
MNKIYLGIVMLSALLIASCGDNEKNKNEAQTQQASADVTHAYICPMHCENSASDKPGTCPVCGMDLVKNPDYKGEVVNDTLNATGSDSMKIIEKEPQGH